MARQRSLLQIAQPPKRAAQTLDGLRKGESNQREEEQRRESIITGDLAIIIASSARSACVPTDALPLASWGRSGAGPKEKRPRGCRGKFGETKCKWRRTIPKPAA